MELRMLISDYFDYSTWGFPLAYFLLSAILFIAVSYDHYRDRIAAETKPQYDLQLGELEVFLSLLQSADTLIQLIITASSSKLKFRLLGAFPLVFCLHTLGHHVWTDYVRSSNDLSSHELNEVSPSEEDHRDPPDNQSMPVSVRHHEAETTTPLDNSYVSSDLASSSNRVEVLIDDQTKTQTRMSGQIQQLRRRYSHKDEEIGSNYMFPKKYDESSSKDLPRDSRNDEAMPSTTSTTEGVLNVVMETTVDPPLPTDFVASNKTQDASIEVDTTATMEAETDLNDKNLHWRFPIKDDNISSDHSPPQKHDESSDDDSSDDESSDDESSDDDSSADESMPGCTAVGDHQADLIKDSVCIYSSPNEHDDASLSPMPVTNSVKLAGEQSQPGSQVTSGSDVENRMGVKTAESFQGAQKQNRHKLKRKKKFYFAVKKGSMDRSIEVAKDYEGVLKASRRRLRRKQLKVYGVDLRAAELENFLKNKIGYAKLLDVKDVSAARKMFDSAVEVADLVVDKIAHP